MSFPSPKRTFRESLPVAGILLFWLVTSWLVSHPLLVEGTRLAGLALALTYAIITGITSASRTRSIPSIDDIESVLRLNGLALLAGAGWFIAAKLVILADRVWRSLNLPGVFTSPVDGLVFAFTATGVVTVVLYAVTLGTIALRGDAPPHQDGQDTTTPTGSPPDD